MHPLTALIHSDMKPALGVTEPGAIAYAVSTAREYLSKPDSEFHQNPQNQQNQQNQQIQQPESRNQQVRQLQKIRLELNSGMYKNAYTCGIPHSNHYGNLYAAALGAVAGNPELGLECLQDVTEEDNLEAEKLVDAGKVEAMMSEVSSRIHIVAEVFTEMEHVRVTIWDEHTNITSIEVNGVEVFAAESQGTQETSTSAPSSQDEIPLIHRYTLAEILDYVQTVPAEELEFIEAAFSTNCELFEEGMRSNRTTYLHYLLAKNSGEVISKDELATASLLCNGAIEARVLGLDKPAMSITGSGAHGIIAVMPLYGVARIRGCNREVLHRATALSYLICMYIKEYSGKLSAFCGCAIAAGSGMACGLVYMNGGGAEEMSLCLKNMASGITGMICDGGNHGCTMKGIAACDYAFRCADLAMNGISIESIHGINGMTPEETMRNMGRIASPGMVKTEETIVDIMSEK